MAKEVESRIFRGGSMFKTELLSVSFFIYSCLEFEYRNCVTLSVENVNENNLQTETKFGNPRESF